LPTFLPAAFAPACIFSPVSYTPSLISDIAGNAVASLKQVVEHIAVYSSLPRNNALCFIDAIQMPTVQTTNNIVRHPVSHLCLKRSET
jgi:hypothetical protein